MLPNQCRLKLIYHQGFQINITKNLSKAKMITISPLEMIVKNKNNIHVLNAPSPAATACLAIGEQIMEEAKRHFKL